MTATEARSSISPIKIGVAILAAATAFIHLYVFLIEGFLGDGSMIPIFQLLFVGNFLGYLTLAAALMVSNPLLARFRPVIRVFLIALAVASIIGYYYINVRDNVGEVDKIIEILLTVLLTVDAIVAGLRDDGGMRGVASGIAQAVIGFVVGYLMFLFLSTFFI